MSIALELTPRAVALPPDPGPQILPIPGHDPEVRLTVLPVPVADVVVELLVLDEHAATATPPIMSARTATVSFLARTFTLMSPSPYESRALYPEPSDPGQAS
jgi:hypothetical protein